MTSEQKPDPKDIPSYDLPLLLISILSLTIALVGEVVLGGQLGWGPLGQGLLVVCPLVALLYLRLRPRNLVPMGQLVTQWASDFPRTMALLQEVFADDDPGDALCAQRVRGSNSPWIEYAWRRRHVLTLTDGWLELAEQELQEGKKGPEALLLHERSHLRYREAGLLAVLKVAACAIGLGLIVIALAAIVSGAVEQLTWGVFWLSLEVVISAGVLYYWIRHRREAHANYAPTRSGYDREVLKAHLDALRQRPQSFRLVRGPIRILLYPFESMTSAIFEWIDRKIYPNGFCDENLYPSSKMVFVAALWNCLLNAWGQFSRPGTIEYLRNSIFKSAMDELLGRFTAPSYDSAALLHAFVFGMLSTFVFFSIWIPILAVYVTVPTTSRWRRSVYYCAVIYIVSELLCGAIVSATTGIKASGKSDLLIFVFLRFFMFGFEYEIARNAVELWKRKRFALVQFIYLATSMVELIWFSWLYMVVMSILGAFSNYAEHGMEIFRDSSGFTLGTWCVLVLSLTIGMVLFSRWLRDHFCTPLPTSELPLFSLGFVPVILAPLARIEPVIVMTINTLLLCVLLTISRMLRSGVLNNRNTIRFGKLLLTGALLCLASFIAIASVIWIGARTGDQPWLDPLPRSFFLYLNNVLALSVYALMAFVIWVLVYITLRVRGIPRAVS